MKTRNGFVSNSSSSSFIIRGMKLTTEEIIKVLDISQEEIDGLEEDEDDYGDNVYEFLCEKLEGFDVNPDGNCFDSLDYDTLIVGEDVGELEDGGVVELKEFTPEDDAKILAKFEALGFTGKSLKTYVQMVSNDNY